MDDRPATRVDDVTTDRGARSHLQRCICHVRDRELCLARGVRNDHRIADLVRYGVKEESLDLLMVLRQLCTEISGADTDVEGTGGPHHTAVASGTPTERLAAYA